MILPKEVLACWILLAIAAVSAAAAVVARSAACGIAVACSLAIGLSALAHARVVEARPMPCARTFGGVEDDGRVLQVRGSPCFKRCGGVGRFFGRVGAAFAVAARRQRWAPSARRSSVLEGGEGGVPRAEVRCRRPRRSMSGRQHRTGAWSLPASRWRGAGACAIAARSKPAQAKLRRGVVTVMPSSWSRCSL